VTTDQRWICLCWCVDTLRCVYVFLAVATTLFYFLSFNHFFWSLCVALARLRFRLRLSLHAVCRRLLVDLHLAQHLEHSRCVHFPASAFPLRRREPHRWFFRLGCLPLLLLAAVGRFSAPGSSASAQAAFWRCSIPGANVGKPASVAWQLESVYTPVSAARWRRWASARRLGFACSGNCGIDGAAGFQHSGSAWHRTGRQLFGRQRGVCDYVLTWSVTNKVSGKFNSSTLMSTCTIVWLLFLQLTRDVYLWNITVCEVLLLLNYSVDEAGECNASIMSMVYVELVD